MARRVGACLGDREALGFVLLLREWGSERLREWGGQRLPAGLAQEAWVIERQLQLRPSVPMMGSTKEAIQGQEIYCFVVLKLKSKE